MRTTAEIEGSPERSVWQILSLEILKRGHSSIQEWREQNPGKRLSLLELDLHDVDLRGMNLSESELCNTNLRGVNLRDANLYAANLRGADLYDANLYSANLSDADLSSADLRSASLYSADLRSAKIYDADLTSAYLAGAKLYDADLRGANLSGANLYSVTLRDANLSDVNMSNADLHSADLSGANLSNANLRGATLHNANLRGAKLENAILPEFQIPDGELYVWGKKSDILVHLLIPAEARRTACLINRECRAEYAKVLKVHNKIGEVWVKNQYGQTLYKEGNLVYPDSYDDDIQLDCTHGIHFWLTKKEAEAW